LEGLDSRAGAVDGVTTVISDQSGDISRMTTVQNLEQSGKVGLHQCVKTKERMKNPKHNVWDFFSKK